MKIGVSFAEQMRGDPAGAGAWVAQDLEDLTATVEAAFHTEHNDDDTHKDIHCDSISERNRTVANGVWADEPKDPANFAGSGAMTVVVATPSTYAYTMYGKTMTVSFQLAAITIGGVANLYIKIRIPGGYRSSRAAVNMISAYDNGVGAAAVAFVQAASVSTDPFIFCALSSGANWAASAGTTSVAGQLTFEVL